MISSGVRRAASTLTGAMEKQSIRGCSGYYTRLSVVDLTPEAFTFEDAAVATADNTIEKEAHGYPLGLKVRASNAGGALPTGIAAATDYFVIPTGPNHIRLADSLVHALAGTAVAIEAAAGGGTHTLTPTTLAVAAKVQESVTGEDDDWDDVADATATITGSEKNALNLANRMAAWTRWYLTVTAGCCSAQADVSGK